MGGEAQGLSEVAAMVQKRVDEGADVVKVMTTGMFYARRMPSLC